MELLSYNDASGNTLYKLLVTDSTYGLYSIDAYLLNNIFVLNT
jgi:hypothetical protein